VIPRQHNYSFICHKVINEEQDEVLLKYQVKNKTMEQLKNALTIIPILLFAMVLSAQNANFAWAKQGGNSLFTEGNIQVFNTDNGIVSAGNFIDTAQFGGEEIISNGSSDIYIARYDENGNLEQIQSFGSENEELIKFLKVDNEGNIIVSIMFTDFITLGGTDYASLGGQDVLIIKFDPNLNILWAKHYGTPLTDYVKGMDLDDEGNILVTGKFKNELSFDDITLTSAGSTDLYIVKYSSDGDVVFAFSEGGGSYEDANSIASGANGDFFVSGTFYGETLINGETITTDNTTGIYLAKYNIDSEFQWAELINGTNLMPGVYLAGNYDGSVFIAGNFQDQVVFGSQTLSTSEFDADVYVAKYSTDGQALWAGHGNGGASDMVTNLSCDVGGNVYLAGFYLASIDFDGVIINYTLC
jgi:hypothetical protein